MYYKLTALLVVAALNPVFALPSFDPFADASANGGTSYTVETALASNYCTNSDGTTNLWALVNSGSVPANPQPMIVAGNLDYPNLPASTGNSVSNAPPASGTGGSARVAINATVSSGITYYSFILKVTDLAAVPGSPTANAIAGFSDTIGGQASTVQRMGGRLVCMTGGNGYMLGVGKGSLTGDYAYETASHAIGDVVFVVVSYERTGTATNVNLWVDPPASSLGALAAPTPSATVPQGASTGDFNASIKAFVISCQVATEPSCIIDEVRVANGWGLVTGGNPTIPVAITDQPAARNVKVGDRVAFVLGTTGTAPSYQWRYNVTNILNATNAAYPIANVQVSDAGAYSVVASNALNVVTSTPAVLTVSTTPLTLYETNLIVVRVGDGAQPLTTSGNSVFLDQYTPAGVYVSTTFVPDTGASALIEAGPDLSGTIITGTALTRSANKQLMVLAGYNTALGNTTPLQNTTNAQVPRGVVTIDSASQVTLAVSDTNAYSAGHFRGAATDGTNNFWGSGSREGTWYLGLNTNSALIQTNFPNTRSVDIFNGNLYTLASVSGASGIVKFNGLPNTDQGTVQSILPGFDSGATTDFAVDPTDTFLYLSVGSAIQRWAFDGGSWYLYYPLGLSDQVRYLTADFSGAAPVIYATTAEAGNGFNRLVTMVDTNADATAVILAKSGPNQLFKGIRFGPAPTLRLPRPTLVYNRQGTDVVLSWSGPFTLVSSTSILGPYIPVPLATSPYTNSVLSPTARFFGLQQ